MNKNYSCNENCGKEGFGPMLKDDVWLNELKMKKTSLLCFSCIEKKLNRSIHIEDLKECPFNESVKYLLISRGL